MSVKMQKVPFRPEPKSSMSRTIDYILIAWGVLGAGWFYWWTMGLEPWGPALGVAGSALRNINNTIATSVWAIPWILFLCKSQYENQRWRAEDLGVVYELGKKYPFWTTRRIVAIGLASAFHIGCAIVPSSFLDLCGVAATFIAVLFGPFDTFIMINVAFWIRLPLFHGLSDPIAIYQIMLYHVYYSQCSYIWHRWDKQRFVKGGVMVASGILFWLLIWFVSSNFAYIIANRITMTDPAWLIAQFGRYTWYINSTIFQAIGFLMARAVAKYVWPEYVLKGDYLAE